MRLDHLLSKEQLSAKADSGPRSASVRSGCSKAETLASFFPATAGEPSTAFRGGNGDLVRLGESDKVKHPVGYLKEQPGRPRAGTQTRVCGLFFQCQAWPGHLYRFREPAVRLCSWKSGRWPMRLWVGRWLRIAQWTRASCFLWLSCQGRTVDALAPGADEGRGRPR